MSESLFFLSLFKRGRYCRNLPRGDESGTSERREIERFSAAALAFCFTHDSVFRQHFWDNICRLDGDPVMPDSPTIEVEPNAWADLLLRSDGPDGRMVHVIECKVGAGLAEHQNPNHPAFANDGGYGSQLEKHEGAHAKLRYVILGLRDPLGLPKSHSTLPIQLAERRWNDLECHTPGSSLIEDLFNSIGEMGVGNFNMRKTQDITVSTGLQGISQAYAVIESTLRNLDLDRGRPKVSVARLSDSESWIGAYVRTKGTAGLEAQLTQVTGSSDYLLWMGYFSKPSGSVIRSVWLYCEDRLRAQTLSERLASHFPNPSLDKDEHYTCVLIDDDSSTRLSDSAWFTLVLNTAGRLTL